MSSTVARFACFSPIARHRRSPVRFIIYGNRIRLGTRKVLRILSSDGHGVEVSSLKETAPNYVEEASRSHDDISLNDSDSTVEVGDGDGVGIPASQTVKKTAKIHDFCLGIPFGGLVLGGGLVGFIFTKNAAASGTGVIVGGALLALSTLSLKVWRQGRSSLPFIMGQAALSFALLWKNFQSYSLTPNIFPSGCNAAISAAMLCFYAYVVISGGNPPPKKLKLAASSS